MKEIQFCCVSADVRSDCVLLYKLRDPRDQQLLGDGAHLKMQCASGSSLLVLMPPLLGIGSSRRVDGVGSKRNAQKSACVCGFPLVPAGRYLPERKNDEIFPRCHYLGILPSLAQSREVLYPRSASVPGKAHFI
jgi:hypothetical protein